MAIFVIMAVFALMAILGILAVFNIIRGFAQNFLNANCKCNLNILSFLISFLYPKHAL